MRSGCCGSVPAFVCGTDQHPTTAARTGSGSIAHAPRSRLARTLAVDVRRAGRRDGHQSEAEGFGFLDLLVRPDLLDRLALLRRQIGRPPVLPPERLPALLRHL